MSHTPTPWQQHDPDYCPLEIWGDMDGPLEDGQIRGTLVCTVESERDVPLLLAAPDLLDACRVLLEVTSGRGPQPCGMHEARRQAMAAIAKATKGGES